MQKKIISFIIIGVIVVIGSIVAYGLSFQKEESKEVEFEWITSGPFSLQRYQHKLGENIFVVAGGIPPDEKGTIRVFTPKKIEYVSYKFDGSAKPDFNVYFKPDTTARKDRCGPNDLIGVWTMEFEGVSYPPIQFEFINEYIIGAENDIIDLCKNVT